eukprot:TRINITY_DN12189_c0_g1_i11.p1 TRINITY_DN12189_c0_g1~~TRINITY_DN12189_c0_g1_i11.p1  ORF type:complete len:283 (-),score=70.07 TRINITY_DN12189_c0_g1_i11:63-911(-)
MQEPKDDKDDFFCQEINKYINHPPIANPTGNGPMSLSDLGKQLGGLDQAQIMQLFSQQGSGNPGFFSRWAGNHSTSTTRPSVSSQASTGNSAVPSSIPSVSTIPSQASPATFQSTVQSSSQSGIQLSVLQNILSNVARNAPTSVPVVSFFSFFFFLPSMGFVTLPQAPSLQDVVDVEHIINSGLLDDPEVVKKLVQFLPEGTEITSENLKDNLNSPQFKQAIASFNEALRSGETLSVMMLFGLDTSAVGPNPTLEHFLLAIQRQAEKEKEQSDKMDTEEDKS